MCRLFISTRACVPHFVNGLLTVLTTEINRLLKVCIAVLLFQLIHHFGDGCPIIWLEHPPLKMSVPLLYIHVLFLFFSGKCCVDLNSEFTPALVLVSDRL